MGKTGRSLAVGAMIALFGPGMFPSVAAADDMAARRLAVGEGAAEGLSGSSALVRSRLGTALPSRFERPVVPDEFDGALFSEAVATLVNQVRASHRLPPMAVVPELTDAARRHAENMAKFRMFAHSVPASGENTLLDRLAESGVSAASASEVIAGDGIYRLGGYEVVAPADAVARVGSMAVDPARVRTRGWDERLERPEAYDAADYAWKTEVPRAYAPDADRLPDGYAPRPWRTEWARAGSMQAVNIPAPSGSGTASSTPAGFSRSGRVEVAPAYIGGRCAFYFVKTRTPVPVRTYADLARSAVEGWYASERDRTELLDAGFRRQGAAFAVLVREDTCGDIYVVETFAD